MAPPPPYLAHAKIEPTALSVASTPHGAADCKPFRLCESQGWLRPCEIAQSAFLAALEMDDGRGRRQRLPSPAAQARLAAVAEHDEPEAGHDERDGGPQE